MNRISTALSITSSILSIIVSTVLTAGAVFTIVILAIRYDIVFEFSAESSASALAAPAQEPTTQAPTTQAPTTQAPTTTQTPTTTQPPDILVEEPRFWTQGRQGNWCDPPGDAWREGHGGNGFKYSWAVGENAADDRTAWAVWDFGSVDGKFRVDVWIPRVWATAHTKYNIWLYKTEHFSYDSADLVKAHILNQQVASDGNPASDWQPLAVHELSGRVRIEVNNSEALSDYRQDGLESARIAADAIRLVRIN